MKSSESITSIAKALVAAQKKIGAASKEAVNPFFRSKYADLGSVMEACKEALNENDITVLQPVGADERGEYVETVLLHISGEYISDKMMLTVKEKNNPQAQGSAISYARRYSLQSMLFIPAEDDDAEKVVSPTRGENAAYAPSSASQGVLAGPTPKQQKMIFSLTAQKGKDKIWLTEQISKQFGVDRVEGLNVADASKLIDGLMKMPNGVNIDEIPDDLAA